MKDWLVMIYANGNNELEPEFYRQYLQLLNSKIENNIYVTLQFAREQEETISYMRPKEKQELIKNESWSGVRRYASIDGQLSFIENLGNLNMADPNHLLEYITWSKKNYSASHSILIVGGHIYQFVGISPDFSQDRPYFMGFPELGHTLKLALEYTDSSIDILILDTCYAATIETLYELGQYNSKPVNYLLTYFGQGPIEGLNYVDLITQLKLHSTKSVNLLLHEYITNYNYNQPYYELILYVLSPQTLQLIKSLFDEMSTQYLMSLKLQQSSSLTPYELLSSDSSNYKWHIQVIILHSLAKSLIEISTTSDKQSPIPVHVLFKEIPDPQRRNLYKRLSFAQENHWTNLLCDMPIDELTPIKHISLHPLPLTRAQLDTFISASISYLTINEQLKLIDQMVANKSWSFVEDSFK